MHVKSGSVENSGSSSDDLSVASLRRDPKRTLYLLAVYSGFATVYVALALRAVDPAARFVRNFTGLMLSGDTLRTHPHVSEVSDVSSFWDFVDNTFYESVYDDQIAGTEDSYSTYPRIDESGANRLIGDILFYTSKRSKSSTCPMGVPFSQSFDACYPQSASEDVTGYSKFVYTDSTNIPSIFCPDIAGYDIDKGGYFESISSDAFFAREALDAIKNNG